jgi:dTDP-4-amino-4,6-dideoxygalactose transaminase
LVEDCALALFSNFADGRPIGSKGEASVFSFSKSLATPHGGALEGIAVSPWWAGGHHAIDWGKYPIASKLKRRVLPLPVHQQLDEADMKYVAKATLAIRKMIAEPRGNCT